MPCPGIGGGLLRLVCTCVYQPPFISKCHHLAHFFACAIPLSFPLGLHRLFDSSAFNCSITCPFLNLPCCPPELIVPFSGLLKVTKCTSKDLPATLQFTKGFHSSDFIWFLKEHCTLIITHVYGISDIYLLFFSPQNRFIIVEEAEANSE